MTSACGSLQSANIGSVTSSATFDSCDSDTIFISANDVPSSTADKQYSVQREVCGDGEVIVNVLSVSGGLAGLELRASNAPGAIKVGGDGGTSSETSPQHTYEEGAPIL